MSSKETVIEFISKLPEEMPLAEIARKVELLAGVQAAREQARCQEGIPAQDARMCEDDPFLAAVRKTAKPRPHWPKDYALNHGHYVSGEPRKP
jgi:hypothetical protein